MRGTKERILLAALRLFARDVCVQFVVPLAHKLAHIISPF